MSFKNKIDATFEEIIRLVAKVVSGSGADSLFGFRVEVSGSDFSGAPGAAIPTDAALVGGKDPATGKLQPLKVAADGTLATSTTATATFNDKYEVLVTRQTDFATKTLAQTYDVPHVAKYASAATFGAPSSFATENTQNMYNGLITQGDGTNGTVTTSSNTFYAEQLLSIDLLTIAKRTPGIPSNWTVADLLANLKNVTITWVGYGVGANGGGAANGSNVKRWNPTSLAWATEVTETSASSPTARGITYGPTTTWANVIDASGVLNILAHSAYASDGVNPSTIYTDYIKVEMALAGSQLNDAPVSYVDEEIVNPITVTAGVTTAVGFSQKDCSRCEKLTFAINPSATHTWSAALAWCGRDGVELVASGDRTSVVASASQGKKISASIDVQSPKFSVYLTNGDASDRTYYSRVLRRGVKGARAS